MSKKPINGIRRWAALSDAFNDSVDIFDLLNTAEEKLFTVTEGTLVVFSIYFVVRKIIKHTK